MLNRVKRKSVQSRRHQWSRRAFRRLSTEPLEGRILLTSVTSVNAPANSDSAHVSTDVAATFDQNINPATATPQNFVVHSMQRGQLAGSSAIVSAAGATVTLNPTSDFFPGEQVQTSVTSAIQSTGGQGADAHVWQLRTAVSGGSGEFSDSGQSLNSSNYGYGTTMQLRRLAELVLLDPPKVVDLALEEAASVEHRPTRVRAGFGLLGEQLVDRVFEEEMDLLLVDNGSGDSGFDLFSPSR